jgi:hypothetical protein
LLSPPPLILLAIAAAVDALHFVVPVNVNQFASGNLPTHRRAQKNIVIPAQAGITSPCGKAA